MTVSLRERWRQWWRCLLEDPPLRRKVLALVAASVVAIAVGFVLPTAAVAEAMFRRSAYYIMLAAFGLFICSGWRLFWSSNALQASNWTAWRRRGPVVATIVGMIWIALVSEPRGYKVTNDEYVLQATALNLHLERQPAVLVRAYDIKGVFVPLFSYTDKRPFFFAFLLCCIDDLSGYRTSNAFVLNATLATTSLLFAYLLARRLTGNRLIALTAVVLWGELPLFVQNANGSGMEMLNVTMLGLVMLLAWSYLEDPNETRATALALATVLLAQTRYESAVFVAVTAGAVVIGWRNARRVILPWPLVAAPLLLLPYAWQNRLTASNKDLWELQPGEQTRFSASYVWNNCVHAGRYFFVWGDRLIANSWLLSVAGLVAASAVVIWICRRWRSPTVRWVPLAYGSGVVLNLAVLMFYYWGQLDDPVVQRLSLPVWFIAALAVAWLLGKFVQRGLNPCWALAASALYLAAVARPQTANHYYTALNAAPAQVRWEKTVLEHRSPGERLIISNKTVLPWIIDLQPAIIIDAARLRAEQLRFHLVAGTFSEILVTQRLQPSSATGDFRVDPADALPARFRLETIAEKRFGASLARISRVVSIDHATTIIK